MQPFASTPWFKSLPEADAAAPLDNSFPSNCPKTKFFSPEGFLRRPVGRVFRCE